MVEVRGRKFRAFRLGPDYAFIPKSVDLSLGMTT